MKIDVNITIYDPTPHIDPIHIEECVKISLIEILQPYPDIVKREAWDELAKVGANLLSLHDRLQEDVGMFHNFSHIVWLVLGMRYQYKGGSANKQFMMVTKRLLRKTGPMVKRLVKKLNTSLGTVLRTDKDIFYRDSDIGVGTLLSCDDSLALQIAVSVFDSVSSGKEAFDGYVWVPDDERARLKR